ncbi:Lrp/AsnC ligand binding domain-containing protein [Rhodococcus sp. Q]|uniref:Lrp/AsnC family transcriptional regulator n=1 Tax=Rhodococcus sp. Q TaxID=2502252 RepID=UPI0010F6E2D1|nr:Lrp/AsnC ligand binding domain-containing protein [Rhodococcus sp. Q]
MISIDELDAALLELLTADPRAQIMDLASRLGVARNTVASRMRRLEETGVVSGYRPDIDFPTVGLPVLAFVGAETVQGRLKGVLEQLREIPEVLEAHTTTGREDLLIRIAAPSHEELLHVLERILGIEGVAHTSTTLALTTAIKYRTQPLIDNLTHQAGHGRSAAGDRDEG